MGSVALNNILDLTTTDERVQALRMMTDEGRRVLLDEWAKDSRCRATDVVALPLPFQVPLVSFICGDPQKGMQGSGINFYCKPNPNWEPPANAGIGDEQAQSMRECILLENGTRGKGRQYVPVRKPIVMPSKKGIQAMIQFGPDSDNVMGRGRLVEITEKEYALATAGKEQREALKASQQEVEELREELAKSKKGKRK